MFKRCYKKLRISVIRKHFSPVPIHILHAFPIFCKLTLETVKIILHYSSIVYLNKAQTLFADGYNDHYIYVVLFGRLKLLRPQKLHGTK